MNKYTQPLFIAILIFVFLQTSCAAIDQSIISISENTTLNTKKDPTDYSLEEKAEYRKYLQYKKATKKEEEKEILKRMEEETKN